jgi:hypothetical protein
MVEIRPKPTSFVALTKGHHVQTLDTLSSPFISINIGV